MESGENMPDKNDVNNEENELLNQLLNEIKEDNKDISEEELEKLKSIIESMVIPKLSKKEIFKQKIKHNLRDFMLEYLICTLLFGLSLSQVVIEPKWIVFLVSLVLALLFIFVRRLNSRGKHAAKKYLVSMILLIVNFYLINSYYPIFNHNYLWILYILGEIVAYFGINIFIANVYFKKGEK